MKTVIKIAKKYIAQVKKSGIPISAAYLFGSFAKGAEKKYSDIDICVISPAFGKDYFEEMVKLSYLTHAVDDRIEPVAYGLNDLDDRYSTLAAEIRQHGIPLTK